MDNQQQIPVPPNFIDIAKMPYSRLMSLVFLHPKFGLLLVALRRCWFKNLLLLLLIAFIGGLFHGYFHREYYSQEIRKAVNFVLVQTGGAVWIESNSFAWKNPLPSGASIHLSHSRLDVIDDINQISRAELSKDRTGNGLILHHDGITAWYYDQNEHQFVTKNCIGKSQLARLSSMISISHDESSDTAAVQGILPVITANTASSLCALYLFILSISQGIYIIGALFSSILIFSIVIFLTRRHTPFGTVGGSIATSTALCIPPTVAGTIYWAIGLSNDFDLLFTIMFFIYIAYIFFEGRNAVIGVRPMK